MNEDGESQAQIYPNHGTHSMNIKDISDHFLRIIDVISNLKEIAYQWKNGTMTSYEIELNILII